MIAAVKCWVGAGEKFLRKKTKDVLPLERIELEKGVCVLRSRFFPDSFKYRIPLRCTYEIAYAV